MNMGFLVGYVGELGVCGGFCMLGGVGEMGRKGYSGWRAWKGVIVGGGRGRVV